MRRRRSLQNINEPNDPPLPVPPLAFIMPRSILSQFPMMYSPNVQSERRPSVVMPKDTGYHFPYISIYHILFASGRVVVNSSLFYRFCFL